MKKWLRLMAMFSILGTVLVFSYTPVTHAQAPKEFKIGIATPLSGPAAGWGLAMDKYCEMMIEDLNTAGGFTVGGQKYMWKKITYDNKYTPSEAVNVVHRLVEIDNVTLILNLGGANCVAAAAVTEPAKIIQWGFAYAGKAMINSKNFYTFQYGVEAEGLAVLYPYLYKNKKVRNVAFVKPDDETGSNYADFARFVAKQVGLKIVAEKFYDRATTDFYPILTPVIALKADLLDISSSAPGSVGLILKQARELGYKGPVYSETLDEPTVVNLAGWKNMEALYTGPYLVKLNALQEKTKENFINKYGKEYWLGALSLAFGEPFRIFSKAFQDSKTLDSTTIVNYLPKMKMESVWGPNAYIGGAKYYGIPRVYLHPFPIAHVEGGKFVQTIMGPVPREIMD